MTQLKMVKTLLKSNPNGVCATKFLGNNIPRFGHHIWDLRTNHGWDIETLKCDLEGHNHKDKQYKYVWVVLYSENKMPNGMPLRVINGKDFLAGNIHAKESDPKLDEWKEKSKEERHEYIQSLLKEKGLR